jgi:hypothetical protein
MKNSPELTTEEVKGFLIQPLTAASVVLANGPVIYDSPTGNPLRIPSLVEPTTDTPAWHGENEQITEEDPDFGEVKLLPENLKSIKVLHRFSNELARHAVVSISSTMQQALVRRVASKMDEAFLVGTTGTLDGNGNRSVIGLWNQPDTQTSDWDGAGGDALSGIKVVPTSKLPAGAQMLVDMSMVAVGRDLAPSVKLLDQTYGDFDQLAIRVVCRMDIGLLHPEGVVKIEVATP